MLDENLSSVFGGGGTHFVVAKYMDMFVNDFLANRV